MANNRKKNANTLPAAAMTRTLLVVFFALVGGLGYVNLQIQQHSTGDEIKRLEKSIDDLTQEDRLATNAISVLESRASLQRWIDRGLVQMQPIGQNSIVRWDGPAPVLASVDGIRPVANRELEK